MNVVDRTLDNIFVKLRAFFQSKVMLLSIRYYNLVALAIYTFGSYAYLYEYNLYKSIHNILIMFFGFNFFSLINSGYIVVRLKYCTSTKLAFLGNCIICLLYIVLKTLEIYIDVDWTNIIMVTVSSILLTFTLKYLIWNKS